MGEKVTKTSFPNKEERAAMLGEKTEGKKQEVKVLQAEVALTLMLGQITSMRKTMEELLNLFKDARKVKTIKTETQVKTPEPLPLPTPAPEAPATASTPAAPAPLVTSDRILEIRQVFAPLSEFVILDETKSAMFVLVKPKGYLGGDKFAKVGKASKSLGGDYVSQGRKSHFRIPKQTKSPVETPKAATVATPVKSGNTLENVKTMFPEDLEQLLNFTEKDGYIVIKPRQFLGSDNFAKIASIVRGTGGDYVSAGKDSHFRLKK